MHMATPAPMPSSVQIVTYSPPWLALQTLSMHTKGVIFCPKWIQGRRLHKPWKQTWGSLDREVQSSLEIEYGLQWNTILAPCTPSPVGERCSVGWSDQGHLKQETLRVRVPLSLREGFLSKHIPKFHSISWPHLLDHLCRPCLLLINPAPFH